MFPVSHEGDQRVEVQTKHGAMTLLGNAQALVLANLAHALARCAGVQPDVLADLMESQIMCHEDPAAAMLAERLQRAALTTLRSSQPAAGWA